MKAPVVGGEAVGFEPDARPKHPAHRPWWGRRSLIGLCVGANLLEASLIAALGPTSALALAPQTSAVVPFGVFQDLRWLLVYSHSWEEAALAGLGLLAGRSLLTALSVRAAWPGGTPRPAFGRCWVRAVLFTLFATLLLCPMAVLLFGLAVAPVSWFWFAAVPGALIIAMLFHHGAISPGWWRQGMSLRAVGWVLLCFGLASVAGAVITAVPVGLGVAVAGIAGLADAWAWVGLVRSVLALGNRTKIRPVAPAGLVGFAGILVGGTVIGFAVVAPSAATARSNAPHPVAASPTPGGSKGSAGTEPGGPGSGVAGGSPPVAVLVVAGYGTSWNGRSSPGLPGPYLERRFSYRGVGSDGAPLAYSSGDTNQSLLDMEALMATQVEDLHQASGEPVAIVAESEGSLVAKAYLEASPQAPVRYLVLTSPLVNPGRVYYPPVGTSGEGLAGGEGLAMIADAVRSVAPIPLSPTSPFLRSVVDEAASLGSMLSCPLPGVTQAAILPLADAVASPSEGPIGIPTLVLAAFHGGMLTNPSADRAIKKVLDGQPLPAGGSAADGVLRSLASAWQAPSLAVGGSATSSSCGKVRATLETQLTSTGRAGN